MNRFAIILLVGIFCVIAAGCGGAGTVVTPPVPAVLSVSSTSASFTAVQGGANPASTSVTVSNTGGGTLTFTAATDSPWLTVTPANGTAPQTLQISAAVGALPAGMNTGHITITASGVTGSPANVTVGFFVAPVRVERSFLGAMGSESAARWNGGRRWTKYRSQIGGHYLRPVCDSGKSGERRGIWRKRN